MKIITKIITLIFAISIMCSTYVFADNVCTSVSGNLSSTESFDVSVGSKLLTSDKVVLTQQKGNTRQSWWGITKEVGIYGRFYVSVYDKTSKTYIICDDKWNDKTYTISSSKLKKNHSYVISVRGDSERYVLDGYNAFPFVFREWLSEPTWSVTKTGDNVAFCSEFSTDNNSESPNDPQKMR